jgi:hypothetical protein
MMVLLIGFLKILKDTLENALEYYKVLQKYLKILKNALENASKYYKTLHFSRKCFKI